MSRHNSSISAFTRGLIRSHSGRDVVAVFVQGLMKKGIHKAIVLLDRLEATIAEPDYTDHFRELRGVLVKIRDTKVKPRFEED